ncbi:MAG: hypothetical protein LBP42_07650 [Treponema sp.]|jgi:hypothetical protein|nr:hypothetical protein [Treponema sp.]
MNKWGKIIAFSLVMALGSLIPAFSQNNPLGNFTQLGDLQDSANEFADSIVKSLPFNSTIGLTWSDAYIGQLIGPPPPHFGLGISLGMTTMDLGVITNLLDDFGASVPISIPKMPLPGYTAEGRLGGFILPFDLGFKFGMMPNFELGDNFKLDYMLLGGDIRYALLKGKGPLPKISLGVGVNYLSGGVQTSIGRGANFSFTMPDGSSHTLNLSDPDVGLSWSSTVFDLKAQVSKTFLIITPYLGLGASYGLSKIGYSVKSDLSYNGNKIDEDTLKSLLHDLELVGISGIDFDGGSGFSSTYQTQGWGFRTFGGFSINILAFKLDFTGMLNFLDFNYGGSFGIRFQL